MRSLDQVPHQCNRNWSRVQTQANPDGGDSHDGLCGHVVCQDAPPRLRHEIHSQAHCHNTNVHRSPQSKSGNATAAIAPPVLQGHRMPLPNQLGAILAHDAMAAEDGGNSRRAILGLLLCRHEAQTDDRHRCDARRQLWRLVGDKYVNSTPCQRLTFDSSPRCPNLRQEDKPSESEGLTEVSPNIQASYSLPQPSLSRAD